MKKLSILSGLFLIPFLLLSQTIIPGGNVSGTWTKANSPYLITGDISVEWNDTLNINPGVEVIFQDYYKLEVHGSLLAIGAENDSILFTEADTTGYYLGNNVGWGGIEFGNWELTFGNGDEIPSELNYCVIEYGGGLKSDSYDFDISNSSIRNGAGIYVASSDVNLDNIKIYNNKTGGLVTEIFYQSIYLTNFEIFNNDGIGILCYEHSKTTYATNGIIKGNKGGGVNVENDADFDLNNCIVEENGNPGIVGGGVHVSGGCSFTDVIVKNNIALNGGGFYCDNSESESVSISNSLIEGNTAIQNGGGICAFYGDYLDVTSTEILNNTANNGGGIYLYMGFYGYIFDEVLIKGNHALNKGGAVFGLDLYSNNVLFTNTTITNNSADISGGGIFNETPYSDEANQSFNSCIIHDNSPEEIVVDSLVDISVTYSNVLGNWSGTGNIDEDPLFIDPDDGNYHLSWINYPDDDYTKSPCINTGDPSLPLDPDGTITDMGAYPFDHSAQQQVSLDIKAYLEGCYFNGQMTPFLNSLGFLPPGQPYNTEPWNHFGSEGVSPIPNSEIIDWIYVEIRKLFDYSSLDKYSIESRQAAFILSDGSIASLDGISPIEFYTSEDDSLHICLFHRNHVPIISANPITLSDNSISYDFTVSEQMAFGEKHSQNELSPGIWGMIAANGNADRQVDNKDKNDVWFIEDGTTGYYSGDFNMDSEVDVDDKIVFWEQNSGKGFDLSDTTISTAVFICGDQLVDDRDGKTYNTALIGDQCWMAESLNIGDMINGSVTPVSGNGIEKYCYENIETNCDTYGALYNWDEMMDYTTNEEAQGICPVGWHIPSNDEWCTMENFVDAGTVPCDETGWRGSDVGYHLKSLSGWNLSGNGNDTHGFAVLPGGYKYWEDEFFNYVTIYAFLWTSTEGIDDKSTYRGLSWEQNTVYRSDGKQTFGFSVRCLKD